MREIKFRLWNPCRKGYHYDVDTVMDCLKQQISGLYDHEKEYGGVFEQYTGLLDKNGTEIYEGDVVEWHVNNIQCIAPVYYDNECGCFWMGEDVNTGRLVVNDWMRGEYEIICNIHEEVTK